MLKFSSSPNTLSPLPSGCAMSGWNEGSRPHGVAGTYSQNNFSTQAPNRIQFRLLKILDVFWYKRCTWDRSHPWVSYAWRRPGFQWASQKSGWSAVTTEPFAGPQPMSQSPATIRHLPPMSSTRTANKAGDFRGSLSRPALSTVLNEPNPTSSFTRSHTCFFFLFESIHIDLTCFFTQPLLPSGPYLCFWGRRKSHHSYSTVCPHSHHHRSAV